MNEIKEITKIGLFTALIAVCSFITIPFFEVPFTMQTFAVFFACFALGWKSACVAVGAYVLLGIAGAPVFSGFKGGIGVIAGPTGGYIVGFLAAVLVYGLITVLFGKNGEKAIVKVVAMITGLIVLYAFGTVWFALVYSKGAPLGVFVILGKCVIPFVLPDLAKLFAAFFVAQRVKKILPAA